MPGGLGNGTTESFFVFKDSWWFEDVSRGHFGFSADVTGTEQPVFDLETNPGDHFFLFLLNASEERRVILFDDVLSNR